MPEFDPSRCANCGGVLQAGYLVIDQGTLSWCLCGWKCAHEFSADPNLQKAADISQGTLHKAWKRGPMRWYVYRTAKGGLVRKIVEFLTPFRNLAGAVAAAKADAGPDSTEIPTKTK